MTDLHLLPPHRRWDCGGTRPVLALHCSLAHGGAWAGLASQMQGVTISAPDLIGHGRAPDWDGIASVHDQATRMAVDFAEQLGQGAPIDLLGHSFGATVCLRLALERPDLVRSLALIEPVLFAAARWSTVFPAFEQGHLDVSRIYASGNEGEAAALFHAIWGAGESLADLPERQRRYIIDRIHLVVAQDAALRMDAANLLHPGRLEGLGVPVLLIEGAASPPVIGAIHDALSARLQNVTRANVEGAGHMVPITHPAIVAAQFQAHLARA